MNFPTQEWREGFVNKWTERHCIENGEDYEPEEFTSLDPGSVYSLCNQTFTFQDKVTATPTDLPCCRSCARALDKWKPDTRHHLLQWELDRFAEALGIGGYWTSSRLDPPIPLGYIAFIEVVPALALDDQEPREDFQAILRLLHTRLLEALKRAGVSYPVKEVVYPIER
jgi:hypothetical protein